MNINFVLDYADCGRVNRIFYVQIRVQLFNLYYKIMLSRSLIISGFCQLERCIVDILTVTSSIVGHISAKSIQTKQSEILGRIYSTFRDIVLR